ncbi:hypothetical protein L1987_32408 [Smallanthus sonchifolius]|uniref:Uncharacterized protein n=1 Tax=Smallanthus sonchifolius TaxID=185202 RepID=A0ACB9HPG8_9ASTR|nr:hypothetical protein L1987_32408 [Smallanthus sonchifolius]
MCSMISFRLKIHNTISEVSTIPDASQHHLHVVVYQESSQDKNASSTASQEYVHSTNADDDDNNFQNTTHPHLQMVLYNEVLELVLTQAIYFGREESVEDVVRQEREEKLRKLAEERTKDILFVFNELVERNKRENFHWSSYKRKTHDYSQSIRIEEIIEHSDSKEYDQVPKSKDARKKFMKTFSSATKKVSPEKPDPLVVVSQDSPTKVYKSSELHITQEMIDEVNKNFTPEEEQKVLDDVKYLNYHGWRLNDINKMSRKKVAEEVDKLQGSKIK